MGIPNRQCTAPETHRRGSLLSLGTTTGPWEPGGPRAQKEKREWPKHKYKNEQKYTPRPLVQLAVNCARVSQERFPVDHE